MSRRTLEVDVLSRAGSVVRGHGSHDLVEELVGRAVWISRSRGWSLQTGKIANLCALAELRGFDVIVTGPRMFKTQPPEPEPQPLAPNQDPSSTDGGSLFEDSGLW